ncbi:MAG TPA: hypothetical protein VLX68_06330 [Chitinivibrionales bacterium]|nr:hypothetical protein [Chitinivibrionales bacterium]
MSYSSAVIKKILLITGAGMLCGLFAATPPPRQLFFQYDNSVWWGTDFGLQRFQTENEAWGNIRPEAVNDLCLDDKELWVGTNRGALYADMRYLDWKPYSAKQGMPSDTVVRLVADLDYVYAAGPHGLARFNKLVMQWEPMGDFAGKRIYDLYSNQAQLWVATDQGVFYFDKKFEKWESYTAGTGLISNTVFRLFSFSDYIWAETDKGFSRYSIAMKAWNSYPLNNGIVGSAVNYMLVDASYIWVMSPEGVARFNGKNQTWENFSRNMPIEKKTVYSLSTSGTTEWFATSDGVYSFDEDKRLWKTYTSVDGLSDDVQDEVYTSGQTTLCRKGTTFSYLKTDQDLWYATQIKVAGGGQKPKWKGHMDETGLGVEAPGGQSLNLRGTAEYKVENKAEFPAPLATSIGNYLTNKNLDSVVYAYDTAAGGAITRAPVDTVATYKDFLYGWAKANLNLNADLNNGRTLRATYDNTDPLGDLRYGAEYRGFGDDNLRRIGWRTDQKTDYFYSSLINPTYLEGAGVRAEFGDRVGDKKLRRVNTGLWAGFGKAEYFRKLIPFREDNFYELGVENIVTESVQILVDGQLVDPSDYSIERTMGLLTFKNEGLANPDSRIEVSCQYQPTIGVYTNQMAAAENVVELSDKVALGVNGAYRGFKEPSRNGLDSVYNRDFAGSVNSKIEMKSADSKLYLRAVPEVSGSYNDSILVTKQGTAAKLDLYSVAHNLKLKASGMYETPDYVTLADQNSVYGRINHQEQGELVWDVWKQYMPITVGANMTDASCGSEVREYAQYLISPPDIPSLRLFGMHQDMRNYTRLTRDSLPGGDRDSLRSDRWNGIIETEWGRTFKVLDRIWLDASYSVNLLTDSVDTNIVPGAAPGTYDLQSRFDQKLDHNIFAWIRFSPLKKLQLETKSVFRIFQGRDSLNGAMDYRGNTLRPEFKLFSQELIPGITLYGDYQLQTSENVIASDDRITTTANLVNGSLLLVPGVYLTFLNPFQLNLGYGFSNGDSLELIPDTIETRTNTLNQTYSIKPIFDFSQDLHFDSRLEKTNSTNFTLATDDGLKWYNEARLAFRERKTRFDIDFNMFFDNLHMPDYTQKLDTFALKNYQDEFRIKWTERWVPNLRTESTVDILWQNLDSTFTNLGTNITRDTVTGYLNTITPGILFDWRIQGKVIREWRTQYYIGAMLSNGANYSFRSYDKAWQNKLDIQVKAGANFFLRLLLEVDYLFDQKVLNYNMAELKATALF